MSENNISIPFFIRDSLRQYSQNFQALSDENPYLISLNGNRYSIHASEIHDSGEGRSNPDEWRIQVPGGIKAIQNERHRSGVSTRFIGFYPDGKAFAAWEPARMHSLKETNGSVYIPLSFRDLARRNGGAIRQVRATNLGRFSNEIVLPVEALGFYLENAAIVENLSTENEIIKLMHAVEEPVFSDVQNGQLEVQLEMNGRRVRIVTTRIAYSRNPKFRDDVFAAYGGKCAICGTQLGIVQAAHILPHCIPESTDHVTNGLALCVSHHKLYDDALLLPTAGQRLHLNVDRVEHLKNIGQTNGLQEIILLAEKQYEVPEHVPSRPANEFLERGLRIRLGTDA